MFLITYACRTNGRYSLGYDLAENQLEWLKGVQCYEGEEYFIINALEITKEDAAEIDGVLKGM